MIYLQLCKDAIERRTSTARHGEHDPLIPPGKRHSSSVVVVHAAEGPGLVPAAATGAVLVWGTLLLLLGGARALAQASRITAADDVGAGLCCGGVRWGRSGRRESRRRCRHCLCVCAELSTEGTSLRMCIYTKGY